MEGTELCLPPDLPYPVTISSLALQPSSEVTRGTRLLTYSYTFKSAATGSSETRFGTWDSTTNGTLHSWKVNRGDIISQPKAVVIINEPCKHPVQIGGLCAVCGKDITESDYMGSSYASRATIQMTHSGKGPTVSLEEAEKLERETATHLLQRRKLSLIVDLDQTIVHATVDPTVGEWIVEGEAWEARHSAKADTRAEAPATDDDDDDDPVNPNWEALKDVAKFILGPETIGQSLRNNNAPKFNIPGCMYYIKPRPGLQSFLKRINEKYEMHVYTMGTRAYAEAVCAAIDPDGTFFRDRVLSRDESGSFTQKSLQRLFPCDQSMVVVIDDRADVWEWSPNLVKVRPYDFFVGIGDINSTTVPKAPTTVAGAVLAAQNKITSERIAAQVEDRPLAKKQELLEEEEQKEEEETKTTVNGAKQKSSNETHEKHNLHHRKALLKNDDVELTRVANLLEGVHKQFYDAYDARLPGSEHSSHEVAYDVRTIIPRIRTESHDPAALRRRPDGPSHIVPSDNAAQSSSASISPKIHVTPPEEDEEDFVEDPGIGVDLDADVWADANAEVDEVLGEETEDDELGSNFPADESAVDDSGWRSDASSASSFSVKRGTKRSRSSSVSVPNKENKIFPLTKRTKLLESRRSINVVSSRPKPNHSEHAGGSEATVSREGSLKDGEDETTAAIADVDEWEDRSRDNESTTSTDGDNALNEFDDDDDFLARELGLEEEEEAGG